MKKKVLITIILTLLVLFVASKVVANIVAENSKLHSAEILGESLRISIENQDFESVDYNHDKLKSELLVLFEKLHPQYLEKGQNRLKLDIEFLDMGSLKHSKETAIRCNEFIYSYHEVYMNVQKLIIDLLTYLDIVVIVSLLILGVLFYKEQTRKTTTYN
jgi:hypothetical protein